MTDDNNILIFKSITDFIKELAIMFADKNRESHHELKLYRTLLKKTSFHHDTAISKHIEAFREFCTVNAAAIVAKDYTKFIEPKVSYSSRVYINFGDIFKEADEETRTIIWKHILTIWARINPTSQAREILQSMGKEHSTEAKLITDVINHVETTVKRTEGKGDVQTIMAEMMKSDVTAKLMNSMKDGNIDLQSVFSTFTSLMSQMPAAGGGAGGAGLDLSSILGSLGGLGLGPGPAGPGGKLELDL